MSLEKAIIINEDKEISFVERDFNGVIIEEQTIDIDDYRELGNELDVDFQAIERMVERLKRNNDVIKLLRGKNQ